MRWRIAAVVSHDLVMLVIAWVMAFVIRLDIESKPEFWQSYIGFLPLAVLVQGTILWYNGVFRGVWRFSSISDLLKIVKSAFLGVLAIGLVIFLVNRLHGVPRTSLALFPFLVVFLLGMPRLVTRVWRDHRIGFLNPRAAAQVIILGGGRAGEMLVRDMLRDGHYYPLGILDDNPRLVGSHIHGVPVLAVIERLPDIVLEVNPELVVIAVPSASNHQMQRMVELCEKSAVSFRTLPRLQDMTRSLTGEAIPLKEVSLDDLLGRDSVTLDWNAINKGLAGKTILVTGGGGSIGSELCRQVARLGPEKLIVFDHSEFNLYTIDRELRNQFPQLNLVSVIGSVADTVSVNRIMQVHRPDIIFHAAAYKHVPLLQGQVREAIANNVLGTRNVVQAAHEYGCEKFVLISTDKAVNPTNVMGGSKRVAEVFCQNLARRSQTKIMTVRFGNVLGSAGSVVPLFQQQIRAGGPITVTHPEVTRYFMSIPEACQLIMQASVSGNTGEIYVLDMGDPIRITYLAEQMIRLSGKQPGQDIEIVFTGLRPGEKLYEELFHEKENLQPTPFSKIKLARHRHVDWDKLVQLVQEMESACQEYDEETLKQLLKTLVPELHEAGKDNVVKLERYK